MRQSLKFVESCKMCVHVVISQTAAEQRLQEKNFPHALKLFELSRVSTRHGVCVCVCAYNYIQY